MLQFKNLGYKSAILIAAFMFVLEMYFSYRTNSQALFADAWHVLGDTVPLIVGWYAARLRVRGEETDNIEYAITLMNVVFLVVVAVAVASGGFARLFYPEAILPATTIVVAAVGAVGNSFQIKIAHNLKGLHKHNHTSEGQMLHFFSDFLSSIAVIVGAMCVGFGVKQGDAAAAIVVAGVILFLAFRLLRELKHHH